jgi:hypothetical protein
MKIDAKECFQGDHLAAIFKVRSCRNLLQTWSPGALQGHFLQQPVEYHHSINLLMPKLLVADMKNNKFHWVPRIKILKKFLLKMPITRHQAKHKVHKKSIN